MGGIGHRGRAVNVTVERPSTDARDHPRKFSTHHLDPLFRDGSSLQRAGEAVKLHGRPDEQRRRGAGGGTTSSVFDEPARAHRARQVQHPRHVPVRRGGWERPHLRSEPGAPERVGYHDDMRPDMRENGSTCC